jgi:hypothetical protein
MDPAFEQPQISSSGDNTKNMLIIVLLIILILSLLGINIFTIIGNGVQYFINIFNPVVSKGLSDLGYASGNVVDKSSDILADTSKTGIDILNGTFHSIGDLLVKASGQGTNVNQPPTTPPHSPEPAASTNPIVATTQAANKSQWCLVGEYNGTRGCISVTDQDKCLSGQVFPNQKMCLNPNLTQNAS